MRFIQLDILNPKEILQQLKDERQGGPKTKLEKILDRLTFTKKDAVAFLILFLAEFFATLLLLSLGCISLAKFNDNPQNFPRSVIIGFAILICVEIFGWISGAHMNPAVTLAALISNKISFQKFFFYFVAQLTGSLSGYGLLSLFLPSSHVDNVTGTCAAACVTIPSKEISTMQAFGIEVVATVLLAFFCCAIWEQRRLNTMKYETVSLKLGFAVAALICCTGSFTGGSLNPVRSFAPALFNSCWKDHWVYWAGPLFGSSLGAALHDLLFRPDCFFKDEEEAPSKRAESTAAKP